MKRELKSLVVTSDCCPGHDDYPSDQYGNSRSRKARARGKTREHKYVRTLVRRMIYKLIGE